ncbi:caspase family protein [Phormidium sp. FACHB-592]|uniref:Caspase family protein n=1 Tax=Stenomitos frigidus AS-A4 TaxID=2933935 RepID=A0ABV0KE49_9CYAN|nr:caspase family protein [Phormidium sp. FACHB-592]MBD2076117.1 caspase family protein [Phormidium sp. FACHB-592]
MRHWAISIGINQYEFLQPLSYAQHDAQAIHRFLVEAGGVPAEQCLLLTETSPPQWGKSTYPDRETIQSWLDLLIQRYVQPGDMLWCFFSGYGVCQQGQDYLMPIEGNPAAIATTAIPLEAIFRSLRQVAEATVLVLLDINRNESSSYETVGTHTEHLASITGIPTILSCQSGQFSRETSALRHGFFTAALLESLRDNRSTTLAAVEKYLSDRLPELSEHYWRPIQQAVTICPDEKRQQPLLPLAPGAATQQNGDRYAPAQTALQSDSGVAVNGSLSTTARTLPDAGIPSMTSGGAASGSGWQSVATKGQSLDAKDRAIATSGYLPPYATAASNGNGNVSTNGSAHHPNNLTTVSPQTNGRMSAPSIQAALPIDSVAQNHDNRVAQPPPVPTVPQPYSDYPEDSDEIPDALFWRPVLRWGGVAVVVLIAGVLLRNCAAFTPKAPATGQQSGTAALRPSPSGTGQPDVASLTTPSPPANTSLPVPTPTASATKAMPSQSIATAQDFGASGASRLSPTTISPNKPEAAAQAQPTQTMGAASIAQPLTLSPLNKARALAAANTGQASSYSSAIQEAKTVKPGQPEYAQAQKEIASWSRQILLMARERGRQGRYDAAIVSAQLVPQNQPIYAEAKGALLRWCSRLDRQRNANPVQRRQARTICRNRG